MDLVNYYAWINCTNYKVLGLITIILFLKHHTTHIVFETYYYCYIINNNYYS